MPRQYHMRSESPHGRTGRNMKNIDVGGIKPLLSRAEIHCGRHQNSKIGKPAYKSQEEQYEEIQELRKTLGEIREEHSSLKTRNRRLEEDLLKRDRQIDQLMDPTKNDMARRKLTDKGAAVVSSLQLRVSRLEGALRDKETQLSKLHSSTKATALREMKIQTETYYQEVVRLRNQLNIVQLQQHQHQMAHTTPPATDHQSDLQNGAGVRESGHDHRMLNEAETEAQMKHLQQTMIKIEAENIQLNQEVASIMKDKKKLAEDLDRVLGITDEIKDNYEGLNHSELIAAIENGKREVEKWQQQHQQLMEALSHRTQAADKEDSTALLQARIAELQAREVEWHRERAGLKELVATLKDDRIFYKEAAQKKDGELESLRLELASIQQELLDLQEAERIRMFKQSSASIREPRTPHPLQRHTTSSSSSTSTTPTRRSRPSSARPPLAAPRPGRSSKASSEPRDVPEGKKGIKTSSSVSSSGGRGRGSDNDNRKTGRGRGRSQSSPRQQPVEPTPVNRSAAGNGKTGKMTAPSRSSQYSSPKKTPQVKGATNPPLSHTGSKSIPSPRSPSKSGSSSRSTSRGPAKYSPSKSQSASSPNKTSSSKSSPTKSSPSKSSPSKSSSVASSPQCSPSKVQSPKSTMGRHDQAENLSSPQSPQLSERQQYQEEKQQRKERDRRAENNNENGILEDSDQSSLVRQRTITLSGPDEPQEEKEGTVIVEDKLIRQNTVTLIKQEGEDVVWQAEEELKDDLYRDLEGREREEKDLMAAEPICVDEEVGRISRSSSDQERLENLLLLNSLLSSHLRRQHKVNQLLNEEPILVGGVQACTSSNFQPSHHSENLETTRCDISSSKPGQPLVRQATFSLDEEDSLKKVQATLGGHLNRLHRVQSFK
ncbi:uncharacterized protein LOC143041149 isoform X3 [Oratosquilla oratoria]